MALSELYITDHGTIGEHNKVRQAIDLIREFENHAVSLNPAGYCVCSSKGKDSRVLETLFEMAGVKYFILHNITGIDPPELVYFKRRIIAEQRARGVTCVDQMYDMSMWELLLKMLMPPLRQARYCCKHLKEKGGVGYLCSTGVRWQESNARAKKSNAMVVMTSSKETNMLFNDNGEGRRQFERCQRKGKLIINPIVSWTLGDIWDFSEEYKVEQCQLYNEGFDRLGCIGCPMAGEIGRRREFARWPGFERLWVYFLDKLIDVRTQKGLKNMFKTGREWFDWWISDRAMESVPEEQLSLFDYEMEDDDL